MSKTDRATAWLQNHPMSTIPIALVLIAVVIFTFQNLDDWWQAHQVNKQDSKIQKQIDADAGAAATHENNANSAGEQRQAAEGRAELATEQKQQAADNSNRTIDPVRKAHQRYEETRRSSPADSPALSDDQLCAELAKRAIACR